MAGDVDLAISLLWNLDGTGGSRLNMMQTPDEDDHCGSDIVNRNINGYYLKRRSKFVQLKPQKSEHLYT